MADQSYLTKKGLRIDITGDYGDDNVFIYFSDDASEIIMWAQEEWENEPSLLAKIGEVIVCGCLFGPDNLREQFGKEKPEPGDELYEPWGGWDDGRPLIREEE